MSDITLSLIVILCTGVSVALLFFVISKQKKKKERELAEYCQSRGCTFHKINGPLRVEIQIEGDSFTVISTMVSQRHEVQTGSASWAENTLWTTRAASSAWPSFVLGTVPAAGNWETMPPWMKTAVISKLMSETGISYEANNPQFIHMNAKLNFLLFEQTPGESADTMRRLEPLLRDWPAQHRLLIDSRPGQIRIQLPDCFIREPIVLDRLLSLGQSCIG